MAEEGGAEFIDRLRDDDLPGAPGDPNHTYLGLMLTDVEILVTALGGSTEALEGFDPGLVFEGPSRARLPPVDAWFECDNPGWPRRWDAIRYNGRVARYALNVRTLPI